MQEYNNIYNSTLINVQRNFYCNVSRYWNANFATGSTPITNT